MTKMEIAIASFLTGEVITLLVLILIHSLTTH